MLIRNTMQTLNNVEIHLVAQQALIKLIDL